MPNANFEPLFPGTARDAARTGVMPRGKEGRVPAALERAGLPTGAAGEYASERRMMGYA